MSPVSRKRKKKTNPKSTNRPRGPGSQASQGRSGLDGLYRDLEEALGETLWADDPFDAEILLTEVLGSMRGLDPTDQGVPARTLDAFIDGLAARTSPAATAALVILARLAPHEPARMRALHGVRAAVAAGRSLPAWAAAVDSWRAGRTKVFADAYGDHATVIVEFVGGGRPHALLAEVDFAHLGGWCPELTFVDGDDDVEAMLIGMQKVSASFPGQIDAQLDPAAVRFLIERALGATAVTFQPDLGDGFDETHALAVARLRLLPASGTVAGTASPEVRTALTAAGLHTPSPLDDPSVVEQPERDELVQRFLASTPVSVLDGVQQASLEYLARVLVDHGCDYDDGRALRVSPVKLANFLLAWLPRKVTLDAADKSAVPAVIGAWVDFAVAESPLPPDRRAALEAAMRDQLPELLADFETEYDNPENFGPARALLEGIGGSGGVGEIENIEELKGLMAGRVAEHNASIAAGWTYRVRVDVRGARPPIWRRLEVPGATTLAQLHHLLQSAFGWDDSHLHQFTAGRTRYAPPSRDTFRAPEDEGLVTVGHVLDRPGAHLGYEYDFGDSWELRIVIEEIDHEGAQKVAVCTGGRRAGPLEDSGGIAAYEYLCAVLADPANPEHAERAQWAGYAPGRADSFDPATFDRPALNRVLAGYRLG